MNQQLVHYKNEYHLTHDLFNTMGNVMVLKGLKKFILRFSFKNNDFV